MAPEGPSRRAALLQNLPGVRALLQILPGVRALLQILPAVRALLLPARAAGALLALLLAAGAALPARAAFVRGIVSHVSDGDTLWVRPAGGGPALQVRLLGIDAPETCQPHGPEAKRALTRRLLRQRVELRTRGLDDYQRTLAYVRRDREDINAWLVREGHAWSSGYRGRAGRYAALEAEARRGRRGLWAAGEPTQPRNFRRLQGRCP